MPDTHNTPQTLGGPISKFLARGYPAKADCYHIEILGGETLQDGDYEPTFEFVIQPATNEEATINADMNFSFEITSSAY